jgi:hypothetical protein
LLLLLQLQHCLKVLRQKVMMHVTWVVHTQHKYTDSSVDGWTLIAQGVNSSPPARRFLPLDCRHSSVSLYFIPSLIFCFCIIC